MIVYYFGADSPWDQRCEFTIRRRNMAVLNAISQQQAVVKVYNIIRTTRRTVFKNWKKNRISTSKIENLYIAPIFPERGSLKQLARPMNRWLLKLMYSEALNSHQSSNIAWAYWPKGFEDFDFLNLNMDLIFDTDHNIIEDPNILSEHKAERKALLLKAGKKAKYILSSSRSMLKWYNAHGFLNTELLLNGVSLHRFNLSDSAYTDRDYTITYCGTLSKWIKLDWLFKVIKEHPEWTFNFIGINYKTEIDKELKEFPNVQILGILNPVEVDKILKKSDVCFGLYQKSESLDVNSMKLYDYLAQNIPVVVNDYHPYLNEDFNNLLNIASSYEEFEKLLANPKRSDLNKLNEFLYSSTWGQRIKNIMNDFVT